MEPTLRGMERSDRDGAERGRERGGSSTPDPLARWITSYDTMEY